MTFQVSPAPGRRRTIQRVKLCSEPEIAGQAARGTYQARLPGLHRPRPRRFIEFLQIIQIFQCIQDEVSSQVVSAAETSRDACPTLRTATPQNRWWAPGSPLWNWIEIAASSRGTTNTRSTMAQSSLDVRPAFPDSGKGSALPRRYAATTRARTSQ